MAQYEELPVYKATYDLLVEIFSFTKNFTKEYKYTVGEKLKNETIELITLIYRANSKQDKFFVLQEAREYIEVIRLLIRLMKDLQQISLKKFIRSCSQNYKRDCYILKLDIKGYFMAMNKTFLFNEVKNGLLNYKHKIDFDLPLVLYLVEKTIFNDPTKNCIIKGKKADWKGLPNTKSLFHTKKNCGLPIGNLTSQLFGNVYLNKFDHFMKRDLGIQYYGRYVDDFVIIHPDKAYLQSIIPKISEFLQTRLNLALHPNKIYLQHFSKGVKYLGAVIKPHRIYIANRTKGNFYKKIEEHNKIVRNHSPRGIIKLNNDCTFRGNIQRGKPTKQEKDAFMSSMNSFFGIMKHYKTYNIRKSMLKENISGWWENYFTIGKNYEKLERKEKKIKKTPYNRKIKATKH